MNEEHQDVAQEAAKRDSRDGLAAVAIALLAVCLIVFVVSRIV
jgi:hypothetical protein